MLIAPVVIGSPPPISVDATCAIYAREPGRVYVTLKDAENSEGAKT